MHELVAICDTCKQPIDDNQGHLYAAFDQIRANLTPEPSALREALAVETILVGKPIHWRARHYACTPKDAGEVYGIEVCQIRTWARLTEWTAHLMPKNWFPRSDWAALLMACATGRPGPIAQASALAAG